MSETRRPRRLGPDTLKALAHPLRLQLFDAVREHPATATQLAERFGQNTGTTSWHLRQLERYGLIEDDPDHGDGRERWWRAATRSLTLDPRDPGILDDPVTAEAARSYVRFQIDRHAAAAHACLDVADQLDHAWLGATTFSEAQLSLTATEAEALRLELQEVIDRHRDRGQACREGDTRRVQATVHVFPLPEAGHVHGGGGQWRVADGDWGEHDRRGGG